MTAKSDADEEQNSQQADADLSATGVDEDARATTATPETHIDHDSRPPLENTIATAFMFETTKGDDGKRRPAGLEQLDGEDAPIAFDQDMDKKKCGQEKQAIDNTELLSVSDDCESNLQSTTVNNPLFISCSIMSGGEMNNNVQTSESPSAETTPSVDTFAARRVRNDTTTTAAMTRDEENVTLPEVSVREIAEAYVVDDELVIATPAKPWWKQLRTVILLVVVVGVIVIAIALGVALSKDTTTQLLVDASPALSVSLSPSFSMAPSSSPTDCSHTITANRQMIACSTQIQVM